MKVVVIGATGAIGGHAVPALVRAAHIVTALARTPEKAARLSKQGASPITVSMFDRQALAESFKGNDAVVNLASAIPPIAKFLQKKAWTENDRVRKQGSAAIIDAAIAAGVERVVQESASMIYPDRCDAWIDEECPPTPSRWPRRIWLRKPTRTASLPQVAQAWCSVSAGSTDPRRGIARSFPHWRVATSP
jgi:nucleoside-diphosphate-sugar epimerase